MRRAWPQIRAALVLLHVLAVILLATPEAGMASDARWKTQNLKSDVAGWGNALRKMGLSMTDDDLAAKARAIASRYIATRDVILTPFSPYEDVVGIRQGWAMFASPQRHPAELHVDVLEDGTWRPLFRPHSKEHAWFSRELEQHRLRKLEGRFARDFHKRDFNELAEFLARRAIADFPRADAVRVRLYHYDTLGPAEVRSGRRPEGVYKESREFSRKRLESK